MTDPSNRCTVGEVSRLEAKLDRCVTLEARLVRVVVLSGLLTKIVRLTTQTGAESSERPSGAVLDATPSEHLTFLVTATGKPYADNHFSESFREWCDAAGLPKRCSAHGLRKAACRRDAENGCSGNEIMAHSGHGSMKELVRYTMAADQARLARNAMAKAKSGRGLP